MNVSMKWNLGNVALHEKQSSGFILSIS